MVLVPFNVQRDKSYVVDLQRSDFVLFENGHAREFTIFEPPMHHIRFRCNSFSCSIRPGSRRRIRTGK